MSQSNQNGNVTEPLAELNENVVENDPTAIASRSRIHLRRRSQSLSPTPPEQHRPQQRALSSTGMHGIAYEIVAGHRQNSTLLYTTGDNYLYKKHNATKKTTQYECYTKTCTAKVYVSNEDAVCFRKATHNTHNHVDATETVNQMKLANNVKGSVSNAATLAANIGAYGSGSVRTIYQNVLAK